ncbi:nucleoporin protein Ndc1-Nup [Lineolata rhizophorae]|uniref:Nucleoporin protein Ndc1-Nup n=1 Tax=Lineolata rhizophorae TaxID=578093 RepID=A0A6A6PBS8_9PEZI|nr:nucleoporin protein Ndc1-Nup [Lineolata rhizophorae]
MSAVKTRPYRDFLTPALHRGFTNTALLTFGFCFAEALLLSEWSAASVVWPWLPILRNTVGAMLLFISGLLVYILRVSRLHFGSRTTASPFTTFRKNILRVGTVSCVMVYTISAWWFGAIYVFYFVSSDARMGLVDPGKSYERDRFNERPIYMLTMYSLLGTTQAALHMWNDDDRIEFCRPKYVEALARHNQGGANPEPPPQPEAPMVEVRKALPKLMKTAVFRTGAALFPLTIIYIMFLRSLVFWSTYAVLRPFVPRTTRLSKYPGLADLMSRFIYGGVLLMLYFGFVNATFSAHVRRDPLKGGKPITNDSADPNGSLLQGLRSKKPIPQVCQLRMCGNVWLTIQAFALREVAIIADHFEKRRKMIYEELERKNGSTWTQVKTFCMAEVITLTTRVKKITDPNWALKEAKDAEKKREEQKPVPLPRLVQNVKEGKDLVRPADPPQSHLALAEYNIRKYSKEHASGPPAGSPIAIIGFVEWLLSFLLTAAQREQLQRQPASLNARAGWWTAQLMRSPVGYPFRRSFARHATGVVCGEPVSRTGSIIDAVDTLTGIAVKSLLEDTMGTVGRDVPEIFRTFDKAVRTASEWVRTSKPDWTDVDFDAWVAQNGDCRVPEEVAEVLSALVMGLEKLIGAFSEYAINIGLKSSELRAARELVAEIRADMTVRNQGGDRAERQAFHGQTRARSEMEMAPAARRG